MYLTALTQRERLFSVAMRWIKGIAEPEDGRFITEVFLIDPSITTPALTDFLQAVASSEGTAPRVEHLRTKEHVRQRIAGGCPQRTARTHELLSRFSLHPEEFFPTTPVDLFAISGGNDELLAMVRFKNLMRIADKAARRAASCVAPKARRRADTFAATRVPGVPSAAPPRVLAETELLVCQELLAGACAFTREDLRIDDVIGVKLIGGTSELERLEGRVSTHPRVLSVRRSEHHGVYNDTRLEVELGGPDPGPTIDRLLASEWPAATSRGLDPRQVRLDIPGYVESAERSFFCEIILTTWDELVESEFGRGLHEERTERQRAELLEAGQLAMNVALASMSLLLFAIAPTLTVGVPPIKLSGRYLPDTLAALFASLFGLDIGRTPLWIPAVDGRLPDRPLGCVAIAGATPVAVREGDP